MCVAPLKDSQGVAREGRGSFSQSFIQTQRLHNPNGFKDLNVKTYLLTPLKQVTLFTEDCNSDCNRPLVSGLSLVTEGGWQALSSGRGRGAGSSSRAAPGWLTHSLSPVPGGSEPIRVRHSSRCYTIPSQSHAEAARKGWRFNKTVWLRHPDQCFNAIHLQRRAVSKPDSWAR